MLDEMIRHEIEWSLMLLSLRVQMCLLSSVEFLCFVCRNDAEWFLYLVLKSFCVSPMYVSTVIIVEMTGLHGSLRYVVYIFMNAVLYFCPNEHVLKRLSSLVGYNWRIFEYAFKQRLILY